MQKLPVIHLFDGKMELVAGHSVVQYLETASEGLAYLRNDGAKVILSWGGKKQIFKQGLQMSFRRDLPHHERASPTSPGETVQQLGGHPKCILAQCWVRAHLNFAL